MTFHALFSFATLLTLSAAPALAAESQFPATPLASKHFSYPSGIPYQVDTDPNLIRGGQAGYNICNSTTEGNDSECQTSFLNALDDFCLWAPMKPDSLIQDTEGEEVAWCTKPGKGTRIIPAGALKGVQFMRTPDYVQVVGFIDQSKINIKHGDTGGELDPHGADFRGNPLGGIVFSNAWGKDNNTYTQVIEWANFMGSDTFCFKACDPAGKNAAHYCEHIYDRIGCYNNMPNNAQNGTFEACLGDSQDFPGVYTDTNGVVSTYTQPPESVEPVITWTPRMPASSSCTPFPSTALFASLSSAPASGASSTGGPSATGSSTSSGAKPTGSSNSNDAVALTISGVSFFSIIFSTLFLA